MNNQVGSAEFKERPRMLAFLRRSTWTAGNGALIVRIYSPTGASIILDI